MKPIDMVRVVRYRTPEDWALIEKLVQELLVEEVIK